MQPIRTTTRLPRRAAFLAVAAVTASVVVALAPVASAAPTANTPTTAAEASDLVEQAGQQLSVIDEQLHQAEITVAQQQQAADAAAQQAATAHAALAAYEPQLRAIAASGYTSQSQSRIAMFLTSDSADSLVEQMATLDMVASHVEGVIADAAAAQDAANAAQAAADQANAQAQASLAQLQQQQGQLQQQADHYQAQFEQLSEAEQTTVTTALAGPTLTPPSTSSLIAGAPSDTIATVIRTAMAQIGDPYVWGASGPDGFDCSGLTAFAYAAAGISLPHSSKAQSEMGVAVSRADLQPGDIVYFYSPVSHVGLYIGDGMMVQARTFGHPVAVTSVDMAGYVGARRIVG